MGGRVGVGVMHISSSAVELCRDEGMKRNEEKKKEKRRKKQNKKKHEA